MGQIFFPHIPLLIDAIYRPEHNSVDFWTRLGTSIDSAFDFSSKLLVVYACGIRM